MLFRYVSSAGDLNVTTCVSGNSALYERIYFTTLQANDNECPLAVVYYLCVRFPTPRTMRRERPRFPPLSHSSENVHDALYFLKKTIVLDESIEQSLHERRI
jgi:hypothetical protein